MIEAILNTLQELNPALVDWKSTGAIITFVLRWLGLIIVFGLVVYVAFNIKKITSFARDSFNELRKVEWLSRKMTIQYSIIVLSVLIFFMAFITLADEVFLFIRTLLITTA